MTNFYDINLFGTYIINVSYTETPNLIQQTFTVVYQMPADICFMAIVPPLSFPNLTSVLTDPNFVVDVKPTINPDF